MKLFLVVLFVLCSLYGIACNAVQSKQSYIVYMGAHSHPPNPTEDHFNQATNYHHEFLASFLGSYEEAKNSIFYSYNKYINGFAAYLNEHQANMIREHPRVISVFENKNVTTQTTYSWQFMSLENEGGEVGSSSSWSQGRFGEDTIIANIDSGIWPESKSFSDDGLGPVPSRWKGTCENGSLIPCNRKIIGARYFSEGYKSIGLKLDPSMENARDHMGHGTHTLSTAAGSFVPGANLYGIANGTSKGGSPNARVAAYKVCWGHGLCVLSDILAAFDMAIHDGVDVISVSIGGFPRDYFEDGSAIGAFHAVQNGIVVLSSAGNYDGYSDMATNVAPWIVTVAASTLDRDFINFVELPNGQRLKGRSMSPSLPNNESLPLVTGEQAAAEFSYAGMYCNPNSLDPAKVKDKIVVCTYAETNAIEQGMEAKRAGAAGMILCNSEEKGSRTEAYIHVLPTSHLNHEDGNIVYDYINSTAPNEAYGFITHPKAVENARPAPMMADFSNKGPNFITPEILKPDITAPGVNILASFSRDGNPTEEEEDKRQFDFMLLSGTSMSCPHVAGAAGLIKTLHPDWSPAAIRSALMTSSRTRDNTMNPMKDASRKEANPFNYGAGHLRPNKAMDPGLVYDLSNTDYLDFLCAIGYDKTYIAAVSNVTYECPEKALDRSSLLNFNYPSITVPTLDGSVTVTRRLKNVGSPAIYAVSVHHPRGLVVTVDPLTLDFEKVGEEKSFTVTLKAKHHLSEYTFGGLTWTDGTHYVRSPIIVGGSSS